MASLVGLYDGYHGSGLRLTTAGKLLCASHPFDPSPGFVYFEWTKQTHVHLIQLFILSSIDARIAKHREMPL